MIDTPYCYRAGWPLVEVREKVLSFVFPEDPVMADFDSIREALEDLDLAVKIVTETLDLLQEEYESPEFEPGEQR